MSRSTIPVIDLQDCSSQSNKLIIEACEEWGCFRIINHPIPTTLMSEMKSAVRSLLDLPEEIKRRNKHVIPGSGYVGPNEISPLYEGFGLFDAASPEDVHGFCTQLEASPRQREIILRYSKSVHELAMEIGKRIAESMGLAGEDLFKDWPCQYRINKYNFAPETIGSSGAQTHADNSFLTILQDDENVGGLEVMEKKSSVYIPVDPMPSSLLVNVGDIGAVWSNGRFYNVKHRVQCKEATVRVSIALFVLGPKEAAVEPPPELVDAQHPRLYAPITIEDYRNLRLSTGLRAGEALDLLRYTI